MDTIYCKYHPSTPAQWTCIQCNIDLCPGCIKQEPAPSTNTICPVCNHYLQAISLSNIIKPFWTKIPFFFTVPASAQSLIYILLLSLGITVFGNFGLFGLIMVLILLLAFLRYAYVILDSTAFGRSKPPPIDYNMATSELGQPLKQFLVFFVMGSILVFTLKSFGPGLALLLYLVFAFCIPATVMIIAIENSFIQAVNPLMWFSIIGRIGWSYLLLCIFLLLLGIGFFVAVGMLVGKNTAVLVGVFVFNFIFMYFVLIMFSMMGYVLYQYHEELGFAVSDEFEKDQAGGDSGTSAKQPESPQLQQINILISEGKHDEAISVLQEILRTDPGNLELHGRLHKLLVMKKDVAQVPVHGRGYLSQLMMEHQLKVALGVFRECAAADPGFHIENPDHVHELAQYAMQTRAYKSALAMLNGFGNRHPGHKDIVNNYFLAAKVLSEGLRQDAKALQLLKNLLDKFPNHELTPKIKEYLGIVHKLAGKAN